MARITRLARITRIAMRYRLDTFLPAARFSRFLREPRQPRGRRLRQALEALGPVFIKFGQVLSTRRDLLPRDIADELALLQDQVSPFDSAQATQLIETALGQPVATLFRDFETEPMASASVAQVHRATLHGGEEVVVKVLRPGIEVTIRQDLALMRTLAGLVQRFVPQGYRLRPREVVADYETTILDELDLQREAANAAQLRRNFENSELLYVPQVYWDYTRRNVMVMERIHGIPVTDMERLNARGTDLKLLAERGVEIFFTQVFRDSFFHADMHPGNIFVDASDPDKPSYIGIDCAIIGSLSDFDQYYLARNLLAIFQRNYRECAELHVECGWVPPGTRAHEFEAALRTVCEPVFEKPIAEISFGQLLIYLFQTARRFDMEVQPSLVLLQKTLLNIEGLGRELYPELDLWTTAQPFLENWVQQRYSPQGLLDRVARHAPGWLEQLPQLPEAVFEGLQQSRDLQVTSQSQQARIEQLEGQLRSDAGQRKRLVVAMLVFGGAAAVAVPDGLNQISQWPLASWALLLTGLYLLWPRSQR